VKVYFARNAEIGLEKNFTHVVDNFSFEQAQIVRNELVTSIFKLGDFPEIGSKLAGQSDKRVLFVSGNAIVYEIVLVKEPYILIRNIKPRRTA
jgi:plasmid stabilization system protein ParE